MTPSQQAIKLAADHWLRTGKTKLYIITQIWGYDGCDIGDGFDLWTELGLP